MNNKLKLVAVAALTATVACAPPARADNHLDASEENYGDQYWEAICHVIDKYHNVNGVAGVMNGIQEDGFADDSAVDIINYSVHEYCPRNWPLLVAIGQAFS